MRRPTASPSTAPTIGSLSLYFALIASICSRRGRSILEQRRDRAPGSRVRERERGDADEQHQRDQDQQPADDVTRRPTCAVAPPLEARCRSRPLEGGDSGSDLLDSDVLSYHYLATRWLSHIWL